MSLLAHYVEEPWKTSCSSGHFVYVISSYKSSLCYYRMIICCLSYAHDIMIWITRSMDLHSDNIITTTGNTTIYSYANKTQQVYNG